MLLLQRLAGASLLIFANKTDVEGCMTEQEILKVSKGKTWPIARHVKANWRF